MGMIGLSYLGIYSSHSEAECFPQAPASQRIYDSSRKKFVERSGNVISEAFYKGRGIANSKTGKGKRSFEYSSDRQVSHRVARTSELFGFVHHVTYLNDINEGPPFREEYVEFSNWNDEHGGTIIKGLDGKFTYFGDMEPLEALDLIDNIANVPTLGSSKK